MNKSPKCCVGVFFKLLKNCLHWLFPHQTHPDAVTVRTSVCPLGPGVLVAVFGLCWAPFHVDRLMWSYMDLSSEEHLKIFEHIHIVSGVCFYLSSAVNPVLYNLMSTRFREMFCQMTCYSKSWSKGSSLQMSQRSTLRKKIPKSTRWPWMRSGNIKYRWERIKQRENHGRNHHLI